MPQPRGRDAQGTQKKSFHRAQFMAGIKVGREFPARKGCEARRTDEEKVGAVADTR